ncbi:MAG: O-antigen ligase family protein, partial [Solirubrobacterales bacterium]
MSMEGAERFPARNRSAVAAIPRINVDPAGAATFLLSALLVLYIALENGGFDAITRSEVGIAIWWVVLLGTAALVLPLPWRTRPGLTLIALLGAFAAWTALAFTWTESSERTATELARVLTYLGVLVLALSAVGARGERARHLLGGVTLAMGIVVVLAVLSRLQPGPFPPNTLGTFLPGIEIERRLAYPLGYASAVGAMSAMAMPLLLAATASARGLVPQALAAAALPLAGFALFMTTSGVGLAAAIVAIAVFVALAPDRMPKLMTGAAAAIGAVILAAGLQDRPALDRGLVTPALEQQGDDLLLIAVLVCAGVALVHTGISLAVRYWSRPTWLQISRRRAWIATGVAGGAIVLVALAGGAAGTLSDRWEEFKSRSGSSETVVIEGSAVEQDRGSAIFDTSSSGRYQFWEAAADANATERLTGIGPGTFEFFWARSPDNFGFVRDAHSLYAETLGELGLV